MAAALRDFGFNLIDVVTDIYIIRNGLFVAILIDKVLIEKIARLWIWRSGESDYERVEVF